LNVSPASPVQPIMSGEVVGPLGQRYALQSEDTLRVIFRRHAQRLAWTTPASVAAALGIAILTTDKFSDFAGISGDSWEGAFKIGLVVAVIWLALTLVRGRGSLKQRIFRVPRTMDNVIEDFVHDVVGPQAGPARLIGSAQSESTSEGATESQAN
jgi:hypothetical protein